MKISLSKLKEYNDEGWITSRWHPYADLIIHNYTPKTQYEGHWDAITSICRGLITDSEGNVLARPFPKFFNYEEHLQKENLPGIPSEPFEVFEKLDGSLGILYFANGEPRIATRGSFESEQAKTGTDLLFNHLASATKMANDDDFNSMASRMFDRTKTYLFEIIYPENRIVVDYANSRELVLLSIIDIESGNEEPLPSQNWYSFRTRKEYEDRDIEKLLSMDEENMEGFVLRFASGFRCKIKFDTYKKLHHLLTETSSKVIWEYLKDGKDVEDILADHDVPDEFMDWIRSIRNEILHDRFEIEQEALEFYEKIKHLKDDRKEFALATKGFGYPSILFNMLDEKDYTEMIWKIVKPKHESPFKDNNESN